MSWRRLLPETLGGEHYYNYLNQFLLNTVIRWIDERNHRSFVDLISKLQPEHILEIGVANGWGAERMVKAAGTQNGRKVDYYGFDLFVPCKANTYVSKPMTEIRDRLRELGVSRIFLFGGDSRISLPRELPSLPKMDLVYVDGGHGLPIVKNDWGCVEKLTHDGTVVIFDDYHGQDVREVVDGIVGYEVNIMKCGRGLKAIVCQRNLLSV